MVTRLKNFVNCIKSIDQLALMQATVRQEISFYEKRIHVNPKNASYLQQLKRLNQFLLQGVIPYALSAEEKEIFSVLLNNLVKKGEIKKESISKEVLSPSAQ